MENNRVDIARQRAIILVLGFICFASIIVALSFIIGFSTSDDPKVDISNEKRFKSPKIPPLMATIIL